MSKEWFVPLNIDVAGHISVSAKSPEDAIEKVKKLKQQILDTVSPSIIKVVESPVIDVDVSYGEDPNEVEGGKDGR